jgi:hypothetical protein
MEYGIHGGECNMHLKNSLKIIPNSTVHGGEPKWFSGLITLFLLVAQGLSPQEHSLICA